VAVSAKLGAGAFAGGQRGHAPRIHAPEPERAQRPRQGRRHRSARQAGIEVEGVPPLGEQAVRDPGRVPGQPRAQARAQDRGLGDHAREVAHAHGVDAHQCPAAEGDPARKLHGGRHRGHEQDQRPESHVRIL
jgi:hypothetical protein